MSRVSAIVLDTHAWLWFVDGNPTLKKQTITQITDAAMAGSLLVPAICVWEIAMLQDRGRLTLNKPLADWISEALALSGITLAALSPEVAIESCKLPGKFHNDPADRMIVATARIESATILTRDKRILDYGKQGFVSTLAI